MKYLGNAFSINMLNEFPVMVAIERIEPEFIPEDAVSVIGHADMAAVVSNVLGRPVEMNRTTVTLEAGDVLYLAQYRGPRLPEGTTELPEGSTIEWFEVNNTNRMN